MSLRLGVDLDGTLADLSATYHQFEQQLFGQQSVGVVKDEAGSDGEPPTEPTDKEKLKAAKEASRRRDQLWSAIRKTPDFWTLLEPTEPGVVRRLFEASVEHRWEVFFVTQRPRTAGASVQSQSQQWLMRHGFETPSVLTLSGSRGKAAQALELDILIDDTPKNCVDVVADSKCRPILILREPDEAAESAASRMRIATVRSVTEAISVLTSPEAVASDQNPLSRVLKAFGLQRG